MIVTKIKWCGCWLLLGCLVTSVSAQDATPPSDQVQQAANQFSEAYNAGNSEKLAALFLPDGEYVSVGGDIYSGREAIAAEFAAGFEAVPGNKITIVPGAARQLSKTMMIEDGEATVVAADGTTYISDYSAVYQLADDEWKIASLRDLKSRAATSGENLMRLNWLIGNWMSEAADGVVKHEYYWSDDGNFILGNFQVMVDGEAVVSGTRRIGWDAQQGQIRAWTFEDKGSHSQGTWHPHEDGWMIRSRGVTTDGKSGTAINYYQPAEGGALVWRSTNRMVNGESAEDIEIRLVKQPPALKSKVSSKK